MNVKTDLNKEFKMHIILIVTIISIFGTISLFGETIVNNTKCHINNDNNKLIIQGEQCPKISLLNTIYKKKYDVTDLIKNRKKLVDVIQYNGDFSVTGKERIISDYNSVGNFSKLANKFRNYNEYAYVFELKGMIKQFYDFPIYTKIIFNNEDFYLMMFLEDFQFNINKSRKNYIVILPKKSYRDRNYDKLSKIIDNLELLPVSKQRD